MKKNLKDKKKDLREKTHLTRPPRMEGKIKNAKMNPIRKARKAVFHSTPVVEPVYLVGENGYEYPEDEDKYNEEREF